MMNQVKINMGCGGQVWGAIPGIGGKCDQSQEEKNQWINIDLITSQDLREEDHRQRAKEIVNGFPRLLHADIRKPPLPDNFADIIASCHSLEHVGIKDVMPTLREWHRILKPGGAIDINVPDLLGIARKLVETDGFLAWSKRGENTGDWENGYTKLVVGVFGDQSGEHQHHQTGFTPQSMYDVLEAVGFKRIEVKEVWNMEIFCIQANAIK